MYFEYGLERSCNASALLTNGFFGLKGVLFKV